MLRGQQCVRKPAKLTSAPFQHLLALAVSASGFLYPACGHEGVDCGKIKRGLPVPPALALCIFPHVLVLFVYLGCYSILIGDVSISLWKEQQQQHAAIRHTFISFDPLYYFWSLPSTLSAAHIFPDVSRSHASFLSDMRKLLWYVKLHSSSMQEPPWPYFSSSSAMTSTALSAVSALSSPSLEDGRVRDCFDTGWMNCVHVWHRIQGPHLTRSIPRRASSPSALSRPHTASFPMHTWCSFAPISAPHSHAGLLSTTAWVWATCSISM